MSQVQSDAESFEAEPPFIDIRAITVRQGFNSFHAAPEHANSFGLHRTVPLAEKQMCHPEDESAPQINQTITEFSLED